MIVGVIGDTHLPYELEGYLEFCQKVFKSYGVERVIHIGDLIDHHSLSFHQSEPMLKGANCELVDARDRLQAWYKAFPKLTLINGNHDLIPARQLKNIGMDADVWMKPLKEVYEMPKGWDLADEVEIDDILYHHGHTAMGVNGFRMDAERRMQCTVTGHNHSNAGVSATATRNRLVWGMAVGCGVDNKQMAFAYGRQFPRKPIIACGVVYNGAPIVEYMDLGGWK